MPLSFEPRLDILPESQRKVWPQLDDVPSHFVLYGGTGIALQLGHRNSEDFDFFSTESFDPDRLKARLPFFKKLEASDSNAWVHRKPDNLEAFTDVGGGPVRVAFFGGLTSLKRVEDPLRALGSRVRVASLLDLAGMKMRVIQMRASWKDYMDIYALVEHGIDVSTGLAAARAIDARFEPEVSIRALQFFGDGTLSRVPETIQRDLSRWARGADTANLPILRSRGNLSPGGLDR
jgi:hypothetical protein